MIKGEIFYLLRVDLDCILNDNVLYGVGEGIGREENRIFDVFISKIYWRSYLVLTIELLFEQDWHIM